MAVDNTSAKVKVGNKLTEPFKFNAGMKEGAGLPTAQCNIALHSVINKIVGKGTLLLKASQICAYTDELLIVKGM